MGWLKRDTSEFFDGFPKSERVKHKQQKLGGLIKVIDVHSWKREEIIWTIL